MRIGIDVSQLAYENTGVANYLQNLLLHLLQIDKENEYILFFSSLRGSIPSQILDLRAVHANVQLKSFPLPPTLLDLLWNRLHVFPIEWFIGKVDVFISSDWTEPPVTRAKKATILYDLIVYKYPDETDKKIIDTQKRKLQWVKKESSMVFCISRSTMDDAKNILKIPDNCLKVLYPGF